MGDKEVLKFEDFVLEDSDVNTLGEGRYLSDQVIEFYFCYLSFFYKSDDILLVSPTDSLGLAYAVDADFVNGFVQSRKLSSKRVVLFVISDCDFDGGYGGSHWSTLVYDRASNAFLHLDSIEEASNSYALKLYETIKGYTGSGVEVSASSSLKKKVNKYKKTKNSSDTKPLEPVAAALPVFKECEAPRQSNGYDCGLYVLAIAKTICQHCSFLMKKNKSDLLLTIRTYVDDSVERKMRDEVREIIQKHTKN